VGVGAGVSESVFEGVDVAESCLSWVYEVDREADVVYVLAIGVKQGKRLYVGGEEVTDEDNASREDF